MDEIIGYSFLCLYLFMAWVIIYNKLTKVLMDKTLVLINDTKNDDILKPFSFFIYNSLFFIAPICVSF